MTKKKSKKDYYAEILQYPSFTNLKDICAADFIQGIEQETINKLRSILLENSLLSDNITRILNQYLNKETIVK